jgi:hypothetical protein
VKYIYFLPQTLEINEILSRKQRPVLFEFTKPNLRDQNGTTNFRMPPYTVDKFSQFFLLFTHCFLLSESPSFHLLWPGLYSCLLVLKVSLALWLCGPVVRSCSVPAGSCLSAFRSLCWLLDLLAWLWFPGWWSGGVVLSLAM